MIDILTLEEAGWHEVSWFMWTQQRTWTSHWATLRRAAGARGHRCVLAEPALQWRDEGLHNVRVLEGAAAWADGGVTR